MLLNIPGVEYSGPKLSSPNPAHWGRYQLPPVEAILALFGEQNQWLSIAWILNM